MTSARAEIATTRASRYLVQLCKHAAVIGARDHHPRRSGHATDASSHDTRVQAEWTDSRGLITFPPDAEVTLTADTTTLTIHIDATDDTTLRAVQDAVSRDLNRFGAREQLQLSWQPAPAT